MPLKTTRVKPGEYRAVVEGKEYRVFGGTGFWTIVAIDAPTKTLVRERTKTGALDRLEALLRTRRTTERTMKIERRAEIEVGTELHVEGFRGRVIFLGYTRSTDGSAKDFIEIYDLKGRSRLADPAKITQVHRTRQRKDWIPRSK